MPVETLIGPAGEVLHQLGQPASSLPAVSKRDLEQALEAAHGRLKRAPARGFRFLAPPAPPVELILADADAAAWAVAVEQTAGLDTPHGVSLCLRLLALVALLADAAWVRPWLARGGEGIEIHPQLLRAAALVPLNTAGGFDETALRALLPHTQARGANI
ncbi:hypothetical protein GCM10010909_02470 [Acidocella aquatica]|uniref:Uncharacterized protein n=1 Tax=Acidocella aquatica TaxID=1922313 RepID=A0ABQ6A056_9PROT|nr:hypothetical protein [Acidocella aquatica]GLR65569.1 hypothetical protein GCM10010909_02470 [Acidocella aquatica]